MITMTIRINTIGEIGPSIKASNNPIGIAMNKVSMKPIIISGIFISIYYRE